jgi:hypothetical protein
MTERTLEEMFADTIRAIERWHDPASSQTVQNVQSRREPASRPERALDRFASFAVWTLPTEAPKRGTETSDELSSDASAQYHENPPAHKEGVFNVQTVQNVQNVQSLWEPVSRLFPYLERSGDVRLFDYLDPEATPPGDMPASRWAQFIADARAFVIAGWLDRALALGWSADDLFGADDARPYARIDQAGLVLLLNGDHVVALGPEVAAIETRTGARQTYRRRGLR